MDSFNSRSTLTVGNRNYQYYRLAALTGTQHKRLPYSLKILLENLLRPVAENIHAANERVKIESVIHTAKVYTLFLARWCGLVEKG